MNPYLTMAALIAVLAAVGGGYAKGLRDKDLEWQVESQHSLAEQASAMLEKQIHMQGEADARIYKLQQERSAIQSDLDHALDGLRQRPARLPEPARADCAGSTGRELSAEDAQFLEREAARADRVRVALTACYAHVDGFVAP